MKGFNSLLKLWVLVVFVILVIGYTGCKFQIFNFSVFLASIDKELQYNNTHYNISRCIDSIEDVINFSVLDVDYDDGVINDKLSVNGHIVDKVFDVFSTVDILAPVINIKQSLVTVTRGDSYSLLENIVSVIDDVDGELTYQDDSSAVGCFYMIESNFNKEEVGEYQVVIKAIDKASNVSFSNYTIKVVEPVISSRDELLVSIAYSLIGSPYVATGANPSGFDCSGFVQYVYSQVGVTISRSSSTQINDGYEVNYVDAKPGDILSWGYVYGKPTHSALYVGDGQMIHATNPKQGVIVSDISDWISGSSMRLLSVRRIQ